MGKFGKFQDIFLEMVTNREMGRGREFCRTPTKSQG